MDSTETPDLTDKRSDGGQDIIVGRVRGAWGVRGHVKVEVLTDAPSRFSPGSVVYIGGRPARVQQAQHSKRGLLVKLDVADDRTQAEAFQGRYLTVPAGAVGTLPEGSYYHFQLIDMEVWTDDGERLGRISEIITTGANDVYVVSRAGAEGDEVLVPALADVVVDVDLDSGRMTVRLPEGLG